MNDLSQELRNLHDQVRLSAPDVVRIALAIYDRETDMLKTFINSTHEGYAIRAYEYALSDSASLSALAESGDTRMLSDLPQLLERTTEHSAYVLDQGYQSSFTVPLIYQSEFLGFLFFDSTKPDTFTPALQRELLLYSHVIMLALASQLIAINSIIG